jgi:hypothetical protein
LFSWSHHQWLGFVLNSRAFSIIARMSASVIFLFSLRHVPDLSSQGSHGDSLLFAENIGKNDIQLVALGCAD